MTAKKLEKWSLFDEVKAYKTVCQFFFGGGDWAILPVYLTLAGLLADFRHYLLKNIVKVFLIYHEIFQAKKITNFCNTNCHT